MIWVNENEKKILILDVDDDYDIFLIVVQERVRYLFRNVHLVGTNQIWDLKNVSN